MGVEVEEALNDLAENSTSWRTDKITVITTSGRRGCVRIHVGLVLSAGTFGLSESSLCGLEVVVQFFIVAHLQHQVDIVAVLKVVIELEGSQSARDVFALHITTAQRCLMQFKLYIS